MRRWVHADDPLILPGYILDRISPNVHTFSEIIADKLF